MGLEPRAGHGAAGALAPAQRLRRQADVFPYTARPGDLRAARARGRARARGAGVHYAQYSFEPGLRILNGFIQSLVGLYDYGRIAADDRARALYAAGEARAREEVPTYDTGAWSLYSRGTVTHESDLGYHTLLRDFLESLCNRTSTVYCGAEERFTTYLTTDPVVKLASRRLRGGDLREGSRCRWTRSPASRCGSRAARSSCTRATWAACRAGRTRSAGRCRAGAGSTVTLAVRDLAGNPATATGVEVLKPRKKKRRG